MPLRLFSSVGLQVSDWWGYFDVNAVPIYTGKKKQNVVCYKI
jgi:hypothetical protein